MDHVCEIILKLDTTNSGGDTIKIFFFYFKLKWLFHSAELICMCNNSSIENVYYSKTCLRRPLKKKTKNWFSRPIIT